MLKTPLYQARPIAPAERFGVRVNARIVVMKVSSRAKTYGSGRARSITYTMELLARVSNDACCRDCCSAETAGVEMPTSSSLQFGCSGLSRATKLGMRG